MVHLMPMKSVNKESSLGVFSVMRAYVNHEPTEPNAELNQEGADKF